MKRTVNEQIYIIINLAAHKQYVDKTRNLDSRYSAHVSKLRSGKHDIPDLQRDWDRDGEENFIWVYVLLRAGQMQAHILEDLLIDTLQTTEPTFGYNRMTSRGWSPHARLRDLERKLIRVRKFQWIPGGTLNDPIMESYLETVWKGHGKEE
jgi:GIY-YIG catalytic domain